MRPLFIFNINYESILKIDTKIHRKIRDKEMNEILVYILVKNIRIDVTSFTKEMKQLLSLTGLTLTSFDLPDC